METKHTPGPWGICQNAAGDIDIAADGGAGDMVCDLAACRNAEANAALIIAAVNSHADLLAACKRMLRAHDEGWKKLDHPPIEDIRAAIAKAEGQAVTP